MNKLEEKLKEIKAKKKMGLMTHVVVGYPSHEETIQLVRTMQDCGVDIVELQIPFSDPLADGPTIMKASEEALRNGTTVKEAFEIARTLSKTVSIPLLFMAYYNTVFHYGTEQFCEDAKKAGISGLIVPDMPLEEEAAEHFIEFCNTHNLASIRVVSPASTDERLKKNAKIATGFVYCTARQGITGVQKSLDPKIKLYLNRVRSFLKIPIAVGFGISKKDHIESLKGNADIAVIGSALIEVINNSSKEHVQKNVRRFLTELTASQ